jgi:hypothetical protein
MTQPQWTPPQQPPQPPQVPPPQPTKPKRFGWPTVIIASVVSWLIGVVMIMMVLPANDNSLPTVTTSASEQASDTGTEAGSEPTDAGQPTETATAGVHAPTAGDFEVSIKILSKQCFGSAGCNISYRPKIAADKSALPDSGTVEVSYRITGGEGPILGTFLITLGDSPQVEGQDEESTETSSSGSTLKIKITDVEYTP